MTIIEIKILALSVTIVFAMMSSSFADEAEDIAEFNAAYAMYNELVQSGDDINAAIEAAETVYKLAPRIYGRQSEEYAIITYNLAELYDAKGGDARDFTPENDKFRSEEKASDLYKKYFRMQNLRKVPKDLDYLNKYIPYLVAYYNSHPGRADLEVSDKFLEIAYKLDLPNAEMASLELYNGIIRANFVGMNYAAENFRKAIVLYGAEENAYASEISESLFWLARYDIGYKKYDLAEEHLTRAVNLLSQTGSDTQLMKNEALQLLATMKIKAGDIDAAETYYKQIITPDDHIGYLVPINKPESYPPMADAFLTHVPAYVEVEFDVDMFGKPFNIEVPFLANGSMNLLAPVTAEKYTEYVIELVAGIHYLPPHKNGEKVFIRDVKDVLVFRPHLVH